MKTVLFLHGLESGPHGSKYNTLADAGYNVIAPDCRGNSLKERVDRIIPFLKDRPYVVGSSYGGLTAVLAGMAAGVRLPGLVLCAPALERNEVPSPGAENLTLVGPTIIIHGTLDDVIPIDVSKRYCARTGATLREVCDDHRLNESSEAILRALAELTAL